MQGNKAEESVRATGTNEGSWNLLTGLEPYLNDLTFGCEQSLKWNKKRSNDQQYILVEKVSCVGVRLFHLDGILSDDGASIWRKKEKKERKQANY